MNGFSKRLCELIDEGLHEIAEQLKGIQMFNTKIEQRVEKLTGRVDLINNHLTKRINKVDDLIQELDRRTDLVQDKTIVMDENFQKFYTELSNKIDALEKKRDDSIYLHYYSVTEKIEQLSLKSDRRFEALEKKRDTGGAFFDTSILVDQINELTRKLEAVVETTNHAFEHHERRVDKLEKKPVGKYGVEEALRRIDALDDAGSEAFVKLSADNDKLEKRIEKLEKVKPQYSICENAATCRKASECPNAIKHLPNRECFLDCEIYDGIKGSKCVPYYEKPRPTKESSPRECCQMAVYFKDFPFHATTSSRSLAFKLERCPKCGGEL